MRDKLAPFAPKLGVGAAVIVVVTLLVLTGSLARDVLCQIRDLSAANSDNAQWNLSQSEVEHLRLQSAVSQALQGGSLEPVRLHFDIFYNWVFTLHDSSLFSGLRESNHGVDGLGKIQDLLITFVPIVDGPDEQLRGHLSELEADLAVNGHEVRAMTLAGLVANALGADSKREAVAATLRRLGWVVVALFSALALTAWKIGRLYRHGRVLTAASNAAAARMQAMVTSSLDAILMVDVKGRIIAFNGAAESIFGFSRDEAIGKKLVDLIVPDHLRSGYLDAMTRYRSTGDTKGVERGRVRLEAKRKSGEIFPVELSITLSRSGKDAIFVSYLRDISDRIAAETELTRARDDALAGEHAKANLLTVMSHEMRTPLSGVLGSMDLLGATPLTKEQTGYLHAMRVSGEILLHHVNEVLDLSQLEAGVRLEPPQNFDLAELMSGLVDSQQATARAAGNTLDLRCRLDKTSIVRGRPRKIQQALLNLIGNALKFTRNGSVVVELDRQGNGDQVQILIRDTGAGIGADDLERIFEDFVTLDASYGRAREGTGLGLAITRRIVDALEGQIEVESKLGEGSLFRVSLPLPDAQTDLARQPRSEVGANSPKAILVVEDNDINRVLMTTTLQRMGHQVTAAAGGAEAVAAAAAGQFDLILMDISMPKVDGIEAYRRIRAQNLAEGVDIVALTAHVAADDHARILDTGFAEVATKPINRSELSDLISRHTSAGMAADPQPVTSDIG